MAVKRVYGLAFHSPLIIRTLIPPTKYSVVLLIDDVPASMRKAIEQGVKTANSQKPMLVLAGSLANLQFFLREYGEIKIPYKVILFDFPGLLTPFNLPSVEWLDCDEDRKSVV